MEDDDGHKVVSWVDLECAAIPQAIAKLAEKKDDRTKNRLKAKPQAPRLADYITEYEKRLKTSGKKPDTIVTEKSHLSRWREKLGYLRLNKIRSNQIRDVMHGVVVDGRHPARPISVL